MKKVSKFVLMLCFVLSAALSYAHSATRTENKKGEGITYEKDPEEGRFHVAQVTYANYHYTPNQN